MYFNKWWPFHCCISRSKLNKKGTKMNSLQYLHKQNHEDELINKCNFVGWFFLFWSLGSEKVGTLSKQGRQWQRREARKNISFNPYILLSISLLWLPCIFLFSLKLLWQSRSSFSTKQWMLVLEISATFWRQRGNGAVEVLFESRTAQINIILIPHIHVRFLSRVINKVIVLLTLPSPSRLFCLSSLVTP